MAGQVDGHERTAQSHRDRAPGVGVLRASVQEHELGWASPHTRALSMRPSSSSTASRRTTGGPSQGGSPELLGVLVEHRHLVVRHSLGHRGEARPPRPVVRRSSLISPRNLRGYRETPSARDARPTTPAPLAPLPRRSASGALRHRRRGGRRHRVARDSNPRRRRGLEMIGGHRHRGCGHGDRRPRGGADVAGRAARRGPSWSAGGAPASRSSTGCSDRARHVVVVFTVAATACDGSCTTVPEAPVRAAVGVASLVLALGGTLVGLLARHPSRA